MDEDFEETETTSGRGGCGAIVFNVLTILLVVGGLAILCLVAILFLAPDDFLPEIFGPRETAATPTRVAKAVVPTLTPSYTPSPTPEVELLPSTSTPVPTQPTSTPVPINTLRPTLTPSITPTFPPPTLTRTPTPTKTNTPTPGPTGTATNTRSPFPFTKDTVSPQYLQNFANSAGCNWLGIAGEVFDLNGNPVPTGQYVVHIWDGGIDERATVGGAPSYGPSGYEQFLFDAPRVQDHNIQLETTNGTAVSQVYRVQTRASCNQNLLYFVFIQNH
jgi:hypothetical protein